MPSSGSSGSGGSGESIVRYAPFLEAAAAALIDLGTSLQDGIFAYGNPYSPLVATNPDSVLVKAGWSLSNYPALFDLFNQFCYTGTDPQTLYNNIFIELMNDPYTQAQLVQMNQELDDEVNQVSIPKIKSYLRGINAVGGSSLPAMITRLEVQKSKNEAKLSAELRYKAMEMAQARWSKILDWNHNVVSLYAKLNELYFKEESDYLQLTATMESRAILWLYDVLEQQKSLVGVLNGAASATDRKYTKQDKAGSVMGMASSALSSAAALAPLAAMV